MNSGKFLGKLYIERTESPVKTPIALSQRLCQWMHKISDPLPPKFSSTSVSIL